MAKGHFTDLTGQRIGKWTIKARDTQGIKPRSAWICECECGAVAAVSAQSLQDGSSTCCRDCGNKSRRTHGLATTREYKIWRKMLSRCYNASMQNYRYYGARGTYVCQRWRDSVTAFVEDMGVAPTLRHTLDRINVLGSYTCGKCEECRQRQQTSNCRWATREVQCRNTKRNRYYTHDGKTLCLKDWAVVLGCSYSALYMRLKFGKTFEEAIAMPKDGRNPVSDALVAEIRQRYLQGETVASIARSVHLSPPTVWRIVRHKDRFA